MNILTWIWSNINLYWRLIKSLFGIGYQQHTLQPTERVVIYSRYPTPGKCKTRLSPQLGDEGCALLHKNLTEHIVDVCRTIRAIRNVEI